MTIDEAIEHATQIADSYKDTVPDCDYARDQRQLAEWLKKARVYEKVKERDMSMIRELKKENAMLRERLRESREANEYLSTELRRYKSIFRMKPRAMNALFDENSKLRTQLTDVIESMGRVEERCAKLRELVLEVWRSCPVDEDDCKKCPHYIGESDEVWCDIPIRMSELGIEVDDGETDHV